MNYDEAGKLMLDIGDKVAIRYTNGRELHATLIHRPQGEGDSWEFVDDNGNVFIQNIYCLALNIIIRR